MIDQLAPHDHQLLLVRLGIDTHEEPVVYMRADCHVCRAEGFAAHTRVQVSTETATILATLNIVRDGWLHAGEAGLSEAAWRLLRVTPGQRAMFSHPASVESFGAVRGKMYGRPFGGDAIGAVLRDIVAGRYSNIDLAAFLTACATGGMSLDETVSMTQAMVAVGERLAWSRPVIADKHSVGGLPGNRTTPIVVAIVAAAGVWIPKTSSRAITSPAGTADTMEMLAPVALDLQTMRRVVEREGGCVVWGGAVGLSPVDDVLVRVERVLDVDSDAQLVASVLSKKLAAGSTHVVIDIPVGPTAKVRTADAGVAVAELLRRVGERLGLTVQAMITDGTQPIGRGIGPALEARDVLAVVRGTVDAPADLRDRAVKIAGAVLELAQACPPGDGISRASTLLADGLAWKKLQAICEAQGGIRTPPSARERADILAETSGRVVSIDNRQLARAAKLSGAPAAPAAGIDLLVHVGDRVDARQPLFTLHAETAGERDYAQAYLAAHRDIVHVNRSEP